MYMRPLHIPRPVRGTLCYRRLYTMVYDTSKGTQGRVWIIYNSVYMISVYYFYPNLYMKMHGGLYMIPRQICYASVYEPLYIYTSVYRGVCTNSIESYTLSMLQNSKCIQEYTIVYKGRPMLAFQQACNLYDAYGMNSTHSWLEPKPNQATWARVSSISSLGAKFWRGERAIEREDSLGGDKEVHLGM